MRDLTDGFLRYEFGWGAYIWRGIFSGFYGISKMELGVLLVHMIEKTMERAKGGRNSHLSTGSFSIDDGDGSENVTFKMNSRFFNLCRLISNSLKMLNVGQFPWS